MWLHYIEVPGTKFEQRSPCRGDRDVIFVFFFFFPKRYTGYKKKYVHMYGIIDRYNAQNHFYFDNYYWIRTTQFLSEMVEIASRVSKVNGLLECPMGPSALRFPAVRLISPSRVSIVFFIYLSYVMFDNRVANIFSHYNLKHPVRPMRICTFFQVL